MDALGVVVGDIVAEQAPQMLLEMILADQLIPLFPDRANVSGVRGNGYCLGTGNTAADYVPKQNYLAMLDEGRR
jgi:hypothetical protein